MIEHIAQEFGKEMNMKKKTYTILCLFLGLFGLVIPPAYALTLPYVDTGFTGRTPDDLDLVVARENYDPTTFQQAVYFRAVDNRTDTDVIGASILFSNGVRIIDVQTSGAALLPGDLFWGISGAPYDEDTRGIEPKKDLISWTANTVSLDFDFLITSGTDDIRVILDYGDSFVANQYFTIALHQGQWQDHTYNQGIQVGLPGTVPGSGDLGEIWSASIPLTAPAQGQVPEPSTMLLLGCGLAGLVCARTRRNGRERG
ncbi:MAG: PEP-CTERM sorting domain-containing protein [Desulfobacteraceae bacterium]|nr:MAG: PEP-CTERM sorting domain-containing protein [Desulfobacteraceae bacterium]